MTAKQKPTTTTTPKSDGGILANDHDVDKQGEELGRLLKGLGERGVVIDIQRIDLNNLKARIEAVAACRMLIAKGICTEAEMAAACNAEFKAILTVVLQAVEEQRLAQQRDTLVTPPSIERGRDGSVKPKLAVVRH